MKKNVIEGFVTYVHWHLTVLTMAAFEPQVIRSIIRSSLQPNERAKFNREWDDTVSHPYKCTLLRIPAGINLIAVYHDLLIIGQIAPEKLVTKPSQTNKRC